VFKQFFKYVEDSLQLPKPPTEIDSLIVHLKTINLSSYRSMYSSDYSINQLYVCKPTITEYIGLLRKCIDKMYNDQLISRHDIPTDVQLVYLRDFLTDQNRFIDIECVLLEFIDQIAIMLSMFQSMERSTSRSFHTDKNLLMLQTIISNLRHIVIVVFMTEEQRCVLLKLKAKL